MASVTRLTGSGNSRPSPVPAGNGGRQRAVRPHEGQPGPKPRRRFDRAAVGLWLGGIALGTGGCILGACLPYRHPVGVAISVLWWGIYFGCLGAGIGALIGLWTGRTPASPSRGRAVPVNARRGPPPGKSYH
jgi:hypothetical protein